jgi:hypothetical protein
LNAEPNNDSPLNTQAAALWANQEGNPQDPFPFDQQPRLSFFGSNKFPLVCAEFRKMVEKLYKPA